MDEAAGAAQVMCMKQTGADFYGFSHPLFVHGLGGGFYTPTYLYGQMAWTGIFGNSIYAFRSFMAFVTVGTFYFLYQWLKKRVNERTARFAVLFATISPWVFQFSRIAWDPPLAPFFLVLALWCLDLKKTSAYIWGGIAIALAGYSYPPCRIQVAVLLFLLPGFNLREKLKIFGVFVLVNLPMIYITLTDPSFTARGQMLALWSSYEMNPFKDAGIFGLAFGFLSQVLEHFNPMFLFVTGDHNLRHSTGSFGVLSYPEALILIAGLIYFSVTSIRAKKVKWNSLYLFAGVGILSGIAPAALTWESVPHALRAIGAWPFFIILSAMTADFLFTRAEARFPKRGGKAFYWGTFGTSVGFAALFLGVFFTQYPERALPWFQDDDTPLGSAYRKMSEGAFCADLGSAGHR